MYTKEWTISENYIKLKKLLTVNKKYQMLTKINKN